MQQDAVLHAAVGALEDRAIHSAIDHVLLPTGAALVWQLRWHRLGHHDAVVTVVLCLQLPR